MTQEEKAKAYDEAIKKAEKLYNQGLINPPLEHIFPELKESEDEKIRKELITHCRNTRCVTEEGAETITKWIAWLEKQSENPVQVEPKFHEGQWITNGDYTWQIVSVTDLDYILRSQDGNIVDDTISHVDEQFHSFTIEDAKDGDVLVDEDINVIGIFEGIEGMCWHSKFYYSSLTKELYGIECGGSHQKEFAKPATKEQRDLLFQKMKEAGYGWDSEKKELKKIEQKSQRMVAAEAKEALYDKIVVSKETIRLIIELFISWHGETEAIDMANLPTAVEYIFKCLYNTN